ncbi:MAG: DUF1289 domain-containing protein [Betaproteobacteria bacterium]
MVASPCINVCRMDTHSGLCVGCLRTIDEIADWARANDSRQVAILAAVARRREAYDPWDGELRCECERDV